MTSNFSLKYIGVILLVLMTTQYIPIEGNGISDIKFYVMCLCSFFVIFNIKYFSKALIWGLIYSFVVLLSISFNPENFRLSTLIYKLSFVFMFILFYDLVFHRKIFEFGFFEKFIKVLLAAYIITLMFQQLFIFVGIQNVPLINLTYFLDRGIGSNSLSLEPSHSARIMTILIFILIRIYEIKAKTNYAIKSLYENNKFLVFGFLWSMLTMGSATAIIGLVILSLYFVQRKYLLRMIIFSVLVSFILNKIDSNPFKRTIDTVNSIFTLNQQEIYDTDGSASLRILPLLNSYNFISDNIDKATLWFGFGIDSNATLPSDEFRNISDLSDYGLITYIFSLIFVFKCCIKNFLSMQTLFFFILLGAGISSIAYLWGILMLFSSLKYFELRKDII